MITRSHFISTGRLVFCFLFCLLIGCCGELMAVAACIEGAGTVGFPYPEGWTTEALGGCCGELMAVAVGNEGAGTVGFPYPEGWTTEASGGCCGELMAVAVGTEGAGTAGLPYPEGWAPSPLASVTWAYKMAYTMASKIQDFSNKIEIQVLFLDSWKLHEILDSQMVVNLRS